MTTAEPDRAARFYARVNEDGPTPRWRPDLGQCHLWRKNAGYGQFEGRAAHRVALELVGVEIPPGYVVDHLCRRHACVRPTHLEPVTPSENFIRGDHPAAVRHRSGTPAPVEQPRPRTHSKWSRNVQLLWSLIDGGWHHYDLTTGDGWKAAYLRCETEGLIVTDWDSRWQITNAGRAYLIWLRWSLDFHPEVYS